MKTTEHGIEDSKDIKNMHHMRLMTLLQELVRNKGFKGAARVLELDQRTVAECAKTGQLSRRVRQALERALQEGVGSAAARQRERNDRLEERVEALEKGHVAHEKGHDELGKEVRKRMAEAHPGEGHAGQHGVEGVPHCLARVVRRGGGHGGQRRAGGEQGGCHAPYHGQLHQVESPTGTCSAFGGGGVGGGTCKAA